MPLSEREQQMLEQMERALYAGDPRFASSMKTARSPVPRGRLVVGGVGILAGLALVVVGVSTHWWIGVIGFVVMVAAAASAFAPPRQPSLGTVASDGTIRTARPAPRRSGLMTRLEERWEARRQRTQGW